MTGITGKQILPRRYRGRLLVFAIALAGTLAGIVSAGEKTEKFWENVSKKYPHESLVCLLKDVRFDLEYTGETQKVDATAQSDLGGEARSSARALGSTFTTSERHKEQYAVLDEVAAARFQEWAVPLDAGQTAIRTKVEVVDNSGKMVELPGDGTIEIRSAYPDEADLYSNIKELVFRLDALPVPCVVNLYFTLEGENEFGHLEWVVAEDQPTYRTELTYNVLANLQGQFPFLPAALNATNVDEQYRTLEQMVTPEGAMSQYVWKYKNQKQVPDEPFRVSVRGSHPRVMIHPNFRASWSDILDWYAGEVEGAINAGGNEVVLRPVVRDVTEALEAAAEEAAAALAAEVAALDEELGDEDVAEEEEEPAEIAAPVITDVDKMRGIFEYVQSQYNVLDIPLGRDGYLPNRPIDVASLGRVTPKDLALMLVALLREVGIEAQFGITSTADFGYVNEQVAGLFQFNRAVAIATIDEVEYVLDPIERSSGVEDLPAHLEFNVVLPVVAGAPKWIRTPASPSRENGYSAAGRLEIADDGTLNRSMEVTFRGDANRVFRERFYGSGANQAKVEQQNWLGRNFPDGAYVSGWDHDRGTTKDDPYKVVFDVKMPESVIERGEGEITLHGAAFGMMGAINAFDFDPATRQASIQLPFPESGREQTTFGIPEGWEVDRADLPEDQRSKFPFGYVEMSYSLADQLVTFYDTVAVEDTFEVIEDFYREEALTYTMEYDLDPDQGRIAAENSERLLDFFASFRKNVVSKLILRKKPEEEALGALTD